MARLPVFLFLLAAMGCLAETLEFSAGASTLQVHVPKAGLLSFAGHEHLIDSGEFRVVLVKDRQSAPVSLSVEVPVGGLRVMDQGLSVEDREKVRLDMTSEKVLHAATYPVIRFASESVEEQTSEAWRIRGSVEIAGRKQPVEFIAEIDDSGPVFRAEGTLQLRLADFGIKPVSALGGMIRTGKTVEVRFEMISSGGLNE